jgi:hypothetical protein
MNTKIVLLAVAILSNQAYAEDKKELFVPVTGTKPVEPNLTTSQQVINYMKEKFSVSYHGEYYVARRLPFFEEFTNEDEKKIQDLHIMHNPTIIYKPTDNWQVLATAEFKYTDRPNYVYYPNTFYRSLFTLTRKNIFTESANGFKLDAGIGRRQFNTGIAAISVYGNNRIFTTLSKTFNKNSGSLFLQYLQNDYKHPTPATWKHGVEIIPTFTFQLSERLTWLINDDMVINLPNDNNTARKYYVTHDMNLGYFSYQWNDKLSTYYQLKYLHLRYDFTKDYKSDLESIENYVGVSYSFTKKISLAAEVGSEVLRSGDDRFLSQKIKYPELAFYLDVSI